MLPLLRVKVATVYMSDPEIVTIVALLWWVFAWPLQQSIRVGLPLLIAYLQLQGLGGSHLDVVNISVQIKRPHEVDATAVRVEEAASEGKEAISVASHPTKRTCGHIASQAT